MQVSKFPQTSSAPLVVKQSLRVPLAVKILLVILVIFVASIIVLATCVAKTGLVRIPIVSSLVKTASGPTRVVALAPNTTDAAASLKTQFDGIITRYARSRADEDRDFEVYLSEASLTKTLMSTIPQLESSAGSDIEIKQLQLVVLKKDLELSAQFLIRGAASSLKVRFTPLITNNEVIVDFQEARLGSLPISTYLLNMIAGQALREQSKGFMKQAASFGTLNEIAAQPGMLSIKGRLATGIVSGI